MALAIKMARIAWAVMTRKEVTIRREVPRSQRQRLRGCLPAGWQAAGVSPPDPAGSAEQRDGKGCGQFNSSGNTV